jgi:membrane protein
VTGAVDRADAFQRRHPVIGYPVAVVYKFFDDQGVYLAAIVTYYAFVAIFPMLLIASSVLGFLIQDDDELRESILASALSTFPIVGTQLGQPGGLQGSASAVVVGSIAALYGVLGLAAAAQHALNVAWAVPRNTRFNPVVGRYRGFVSFALAGTLVIATTFLSVTLSNLGSLQPGVGTWARGLGTVGSVALTAAVLALMMRYTTARRPSFRTCLPGALVIAVLWQGLQVAGSIYVRRVINVTSEMNSIFALVLGLVGLLFLAAVSAVLGIEVSVVAKERLYPRALLTPFTDNVDLTEADRRAYDSYAKAMRHKGFQRIQVVFDSQAKHESRGGADGEEEPGRPFHPPPDEAPRTE